MVAARGRLPLPRESLRVVYRRVLVHLNRKGKSGAIKAVFQLGRKGSDAAMRDVGVLEHAVGRLLAWLVSGEK
jgi:hypothetical protein